jgi:hypothetical protein
MSFDAYRAPAQQRDARPGVIRWFRVYAGLMAIASAAGLAFAILAATTNDASLAPIVTCVLLGALAAFYGSAAFVPFEPWGWTVALIAIALGLAGCAAVVAIPLLVFWLKPVTRAAFARL